MLTVYFENEYEGGDIRTLFPFPPAETAEKVIGEVLRSVGCSRSCEVSLTLVGDEAMRELNRETRGIDRTTDVLSFPVFQYTQPGHTEEAESDRAGSFNPETGALLLGDIVISVPRTLSQAEEYGHSVKREFAFLTAHSALHLLGFDHMSPEEETEMTARQEQVLDALGITRK